MLSHPQDFGDSPAADAALEADTHVSSVTLSQIGCFAPSTALGMGSLEMSLEQMTAAAYLVRGKQ